MTSNTSIGSASSIGCSGISLIAVRIRFLHSGLDPPDQLDPDAVRIACERELVPLLAERLNLRASAFCDDFFERATDVGDPERQAVWLLPLAISGEEFAPGRIPV